MGVECEFFVKQIILRIFQDIKLDFGALDEFKTAFGEWMEGVNDRLDKIECSCRQNSTQKAKKGATENAE